MPNSTPKLIFGGAGLGFGGFFGDLDNARTVIDYLKQNGIDTIDVAQNYGNSEEVLGKIGAASRFTIDTKYSGPLSQLDGSTETVLRSGQESLEKLGTKQVNVYYIHMPDRTKPIEPTLAGLDQLYKAGTFKQLGLSNFTAEEVDNVFRICREKNYILPTVYQGNYSALARRAETELLPTLRKHNMAYYIYSPIAGGFLTKTSEQIRAGGQGRWDPTSFLGEMYHTMYNKTSMLKALDLWGEIADSAKISRGELAYRWVVHHSALKGENGDGVIFGVSDFKQLQETVGYVKAGPLDESVVKRVDGIWELVSGDAPLNNDEPLAGMMHKKILEAQRLKEQQAAKSS